jgi:hypothetical protein
MIKNTYVCKCSNERKESNHWFLIKIVKGDLLISRWNAKKANEHNVEHVCGPGCLSRLISEWTGELKWFFRVNSANSTPGRGWSGRASLPLWTSALVSWCMTLPLKVTALSSGRTAPAQTLRIALQCGLSVCRGTENNSRKPLDTLSQ